MWSATMANVRGRKHRRGTIAKVLRSWPRCEDKTVAALWSKAALGTPS